MIEPAIDVNPHFEGRIVRTDLLRPSGTIALWISLSRRPTNGIIISLRALGFNLEAAIVNGSIVLSRNGYTAQRPLSVSTVSELEGGGVLKDPCSIVINWSPTSLAVYVNGCGSKVDTLATLPPNDLLQWARRQAILPVREYDTNRAFRDTILNGLAGLQDKINTTAMQYAFWDFSYVNKSIGSRRPKRETQIHPTVHGLLYDFALAKNITIHPEAATGPGRLDFLITGVVRGGVIAKACVEFKNSHSKDVVHGLTNQLPEYMRTHGTDIGFYCVLWYKGEYFDKPNQDLGLFRGSLIGEKLDVGLGHLNIILIDVSWQTPPSKAITTS